EKVGKMLFFDPRVSGDNNMSCATCHSPMFGWSDGLETGKGFQSQVLGRATPTITNTAYNSIQMWDGRKRDLEDQATGPMEAGVEMNTDIPALLKWLKMSEGYSAAFKKAYPKQGINKDTLAGAIASFERTVISNNSPFDNWVKGDKKAMTKQQIKGFKLFVDADEGNCMACHSGPNFTDDGFHNVGLKSFGAKNPDMGRHAQKPLKSMKGAFKTPTLRDVTLTAPYFHDGSVATLKGVVEHYAKGGEVQSNLSANMKKKLPLSKKEVKAIVAFIEALESPHDNFVLPVLPLN
ncbi:MAG: c-type cytochrome, partial [Pseudomonadales bacterium]|nr:c-type cytochrome [Pseudomonadales bacterium]